MSVVLARQPLGFVWPTPDPFLFCAYHLDAYPQGDERMAPPAEALAGRDIGQDFTVKDGWRMYHGQVVPGFPAHPHRGFETVTVVRRGFVDHADSLGAGARYGQGDVQWLTAGRGVVHAEMFPLVEQDRDNPLELFQIWLNLPRSHKMAEPRFEMFWDAAIPRHVARDEAGGTTEVTVIAGRLGEATPPAPPPDSWAAQPDADVAIWTLRLSPGARFTLPATAATSHRVLYFFGGSALTVGGEAVPTQHALAVRPDVDVELVAGPDEVELLMLQGRPIGEPVAQHGPFVMNTRGELKQAFLDYQQTRFGGWPWPSDAPVHPRDGGRFARRPDGTVERP